MGSPDQVISNRRYLLKGIDGEAVAVTTRELAQIIREQIDQILKPLMETLNKDAGRLKVLYITGGGSMLQGIDSYIRRLTSVPVSYGSHACWLTANTPDECCRPKYASLVGTLLLGAAYREKHPQVKSYEKNKRIIETLKDTTLKLFSDQDDF
jgi:cell division ATPase FtsA